VSPDLKVELVAHEPQVIDPVAIRFDEAGRMWVVEMRDYPTGSAGGNPASSRISVLEDEDGDAFYESSSVFADNLQFATGVQPWKGGVFVTMAGEVAYMKDTDGDGRADLVETWFTGFAEQNTQLRANDPWLALDNRIYVANGLRGGVIVDARRPERRPLSISGMDFCFDPLTGECEAVAGAGQFGMTFDDYGNRFICSNRNPALHVVLENRQLKKNPLVAVPAVTQDVARSGDHSRIFPITSSWTTSNLHAGQFTAACGVEVYRGDALPSEYRGNIFTCEPTGHLVHREIMVPSGVSFTSKPAEEGREFLASSDPWFSPVNLEVGPDGALYVVDMYRAVIEHPEWMPPELQKRPDMLLGNDRGRIYRIRSRAAGKVRGAPTLANATSNELVEMLNDANSWTRETAARIMLERQDKTASHALLSVAKDGNPLGRIHANRLLASLSLLNDDHLLEVINDPNPRVTEQLIALAEPFARGHGPLREQLVQLTVHEDARVRMAALFALAPYVSTPARPADVWEQQAMLIAAGDAGGQFIAGLLNDSKRLEANVGDLRPFIASAARLAAASTRNTEHIQAITALLASPAYQQVGLASFLSERDRRGRPLADLEARLSNDLRNRLERAFTQARDTADNHNASADARIEAIGLLACSENFIEIISTLAASDPEQVVRLKAIAALINCDAIEPWQRLLTNYSSESPVVQRAILDGMLSCSDRTSLILDNVADGHLPPTAIDAARTTQLLNHSDESIRRRAQTLFASAIPTDRQRVLAEYQIVLGMQADPKHGREVFAQYCASCHKVSNVGVSFAPDISDSREKTAAQLLTDIVQPNRAVDANHFSYTALTVDGLAVTGILTAETSTSVTLREAADKETTLRRDEIEQLASNGVSLMPDGLERDISHQDMADLIGFIKNWRYLEDPAAPPVK
jgi:putative membrane-bound dehydrogenase-like protein